jgi:hypothetical protein
MKPVVLLEMNEVSLPFLEKYAAQGRLPAFRLMLEKHGYVVTESESVYEQLEPWIQWVTLHSGLDFAQHGIFRLGDAVHSDVRQVFEILEEKGLRVGAVSPINAANRLRNAAFFVPDPWTAGAVSGPGNLRRLYEAISQAVNDNAQSRISVKSLQWLVGGFARYSRLANLPRYLQYALKARKKPWTRALFLDCLLSDVFIKLWLETRPDFASLFLNGAAHIQHHYFFNSSAYSGSQRNPEWYIGHGDDPVLEAYELYDSILGNVERAAPDARILVATGLSQEPCESPVYYYRLRDHAAFLKRIGIEYNRVLARMSRDFLIECRDATQAKKAERVLRSGTLGEIPLFEVDNRGNSLFVTLSYPNRIEDHARASFSNGAVDGFGRELAFVAMKNGRHDGAGYLIDTGTPKTARERVPLASVFHRLVNACTA